MTGKKQIKLAGAVVDGLTEDIVSTTTTTINEQREQQTDCYKKISVSVGLCEFIIQLFMNEETLVMSCYYCCCCYYYCVLEW